MNSWRHVRKNRSPLLKSAATSRRSQNSSRSRWQQRQNSEVSSGRGTQTLSRLAFTSAILLSFATTQLHRRQEEIWRDAGIRRAWFCSARLDKFGWADTGRTSFRLTEAQSALGRKSCLAQRRNCRRRGLRSENWMRFSHASTIVPISQSALRRARSSPSVSGRKFSRNASRRRPVVSHFEAPILPQLNSRFAFP